MVLDSLANLTIKFRYSDFQISTNAEVISEIPYSLLQYMKEIQSILPILNSAELALSHNEVDILLDVEFYEYVIGTTSFFC